METTTKGFYRALEYPLLSAIFNRRSRRVSKGIRSIHAGSLSYVSEKRAESLTALEEALLIAVTGCNRAYNARQAVSDAKWRNDARVSQY
jgi:hypothetical protein